MPLSLASNPYYITFSYTRHSRVTVTDYDKHPKCSPFPASADTTLPTPDMTSTSGLHTGQRCSRASTPPVGPALSKRAVMPGYPGTFTPPVLSWDRQPAEGQPLGTGCHLPSFGNATTAFLRLSKSAGPQAQTPNLRDTD